MAVVATGSARTFFDRLVTAWSAVHVPATTEITTHDCAECEEIAEYFGGRPWQQFTNVRELRYHSEALALFSAAAFHYYLPAYMMAALNDSAVADVIPDSIQFSFASEFGPAARGRLERFTQQQRVLVAEFLEQVGDGDDDVATLVSLLRHG